MLASDKAKDIVLDGWANGDHIKEIQKTLNRHLETVDGKPLRECRIRRILKIEYENGDPRAAHRNKNALGLLGTRCELRHTRVGRCATGNNSNITSPPYQRDRAEVYLRFAAGRYPFLRTKCRGPGNHRENGI